MSLLLLADDSENIKEVGFDVTAYKMYNSIIANQHINN